MKKLFIGLISTFVLSVGFVATASAAENVALFFNTSYVDSSGTSSSSEPYNLKLSLESFGHTVTTFTGITAAEVTTALIGKSILAMPEMESGDLNTAMAADAKQVINDWVTAGGILIVMNDSSNRGGSIINGIFGGWSLQAGQSLYDGTLFPKQSDTTGTLFESGPASIPGYSLTLPLLVSSLPSGALNLYGDGDNETVLFYKSEGYGAVYFFAWDWYNAAPNGAEDAGWLDVLETSTIPPVVKISEISGDVTESGGTATFTAVLLKAPTANVTFSLASSDTTEGTISASSVTFTSANWDTPQTFTVTGVDDSLDDDDIQFQITTGSTASADADFNNKLPRNVVVTCVDNDTPPTITSNGGGATAAISVAENQTAVTTVTATDPEQSPTFSISGGADQASFSIDGGIGVLTFYSAPDYETKTSYTVEITASDGNLTDTQTITVTVTDVDDNNPVITSNGGGATAVINAAENQTAVTTVTSTDADAISTVTYSLTGGADQVSFSIVGATGVLTFQNAPDREAQSTYVVEVTASDTTNTDVQTITVTITDVNDNIPVITSNGGGATAAINAAENQTAVTTVVAIDADSTSTVTYSISGGADQASFGIVGATGALTFNAAPDYETKASYVVEVTASDTTNTDVQIITVTVTDVNDSNPVITSNGGGATAAVNAAENQTAVTTVAATDADSTSTVTYSISGGADQASFGIVGATGVLTFNTAPDRETKSSYVVEVTASDTTNTDTQIITITVTDVNDNTPVITSNGGGATAAINAAENQTTVTTVVASDADSTSTVTYSISGGADQASFGIVGATGVLTFNSAPDYETKTSYVVEVTASDSTNTDVQTITVTVTDVDDNNPVITSNGGGATAAISVAENQTAVTTVTATDADAISTVTYSVSGGADQASFGIVGATGVLTFNAAPDYETKASYVVEVTASDTTNTDVQIITVTVTDVDDNNPVITSNGGGVTAAISVAENQTAVTTVTATDADAISTVTYSVSGGADQASFGIVSSTGVLTFNSAPDYETKISYVVQVTASDGTNNDTQTITVSVTNVNEAPSITSSAITTAVEGVAYSYTVIASDYDAGTTFTYTAPTKPSWLTISSATGVLAGTPPNAAIGGHSVVVIASDGSLNSQQSFTITVQADLDGDGTPDISDDDVDGDGMSNTFENTHGLDPRDASDASGDLDGDGLTNLEEYTEGKNPTQDDVAPEVTAPDNITVDSEELYTTVSLGIATAVDGLDGALTPTPDVSGRFAPGTHTITWSSTDAAGNTGTTTQTVKVKPQVSFSKDQTIGEDGAPQVTVGVYLNGTAADYPVEIPYVVTGTAITPDDYDLVSGTVTIISGTSSTITFNIVDDGIGDNDETVILSFGSIINAVAGPQATHTVTLTEVNAAPIVSFVAVQGGELTTTAVKIAGSVTVTATISDPNSNDLHTLDWSATNRSLVDSDSSDNTFTFDPSGLDAGVYSIALTVTDDAQSPLSASVQMTVLVIASAPNLTNTQDADGDGQNDLDEGYNDDDGDGIPEYLDSNPASNVIEEISATGNSFLLETNPGLKIKLSDIALQTGDFAAGVTNTDIVVFTDAQEDVVTNTGGYFDFEITDIPEAGQSVQIVIAQFAQIPEKPVYRKLMNGIWQDFIENSNNSIASAAGAEGYCPPPGDTAYQSGLTPGYWCVQLTIEDGGSNDADGAANHGIKDPGGVGSMNDYDVTVEGGGGGGSIDFKFILAIMMMLGFLRLTHKNNLLRKNISLVVFASILSIYGINAKAESNFIVGFNFGIADGDESMVKLNSELASQGINATVTASDDGERTTTNFYAGYQYYPRLWVQLEYLNLGDVSTKISGSASQLDSFLTSVEKVHPSSAKGFVLTQAYRYPINDRFTAVATLGVFQWRSEYTISGATVTKTYKDSGTDFTFGAGLEIDISDNFYSQIGFRRVNLDGEGINNYSAGIGYRF